MRERKRESYHDRHCRIVNVRLVSFLTIGLKLLCLFREFCGVQKQKGKLVISKSESFSHMAYCILRSTKTKFCEFP